TVAVTGTACVVVPVPPTLSVTVRRTTNVPGLANACVVETVVPVVPSPKSHAYEAIVVPAALVDPDPLKKTVWPVEGVVGENEKLAVGFTTAETVTVLSVVADCPAAL